MLNFLLAIKYQSNLVPRVAPGNHELKVEEIFISICKCPFNSHDCLVVSNIDCSRFWVYALHEKADFLFGTSLRVMQSDPD